MSENGLRGGLTGLVAPVSLILCFCLPLFLGLGGTDLQNDEAIYSYAAQSILETGDWLSPRASPDDWAVFLEKPPLKFWMVAAPIGLGLLPNDEFGLRFLDAVLGSLAFAYVFLIGRRTAGTLSGLAAVLLLFAHPQLLFEHGLRSNNMEAALLLSYCGGVYHYLAWVSASSTPRAARHVAAVAAFFFLGVMTKFVAALFLPVVLGVTALAAPAHRRLLWRDRLPWALAALAVVAAAAPWFIYQYRVAGPVLWQVMFAQHVVTRFSTHVDPAHVQPWPFYFTSLRRELVRSGSAFWIAAGLAVLVVRTIRERRADGLLLLVWAFAPMTIISFGTSKLYHYLYPFLPPFAIAGGWWIGWVVSGLRAVSTPSRAYSMHRFLQAPPARLALVGIAAVALAVAVGTAAAGPLRVEAGGLVLRNSSIARPGAVALVFALLAGRRPFALVVAVVAVFLVLPTPARAYVDNVRRTRASAQPLRQLAQCLRRIDAGRRAVGAPVPGVYAPISEPAFRHPYFFYLRHAGGWSRPEAVEHGVMRQALFAAGGERPVLLDADRYAEFLSQTPLAGPLPAVVPMDGAVLLLPGAYASCRIP